jgi:hypothetical protein
MSSQPLRFDEDFSKAVSIKKEAFCPKAKGDLNYSFFLCGIAPITGAVGQG